MRGHGACLGDNTIFVRARWSMSAAPLAVIVNGGSLEEIACPSSTDFLSDVGVSVRCAITQEESAEWWGPDAEVVVYEQPALVYEANGSQPVSIAIEAGQFPMVQTWCVEWRADLKGRDVEGPWANGNH